MVTAVVWCGLFTIYCLDHLAVKSVATASVAPSISAETTWQAATTRQPLLDALIEQCQIESDDDIDCAFNRPVRLLLNICCYCAQAVTIASQVLALCDNADSQCTTSGRPTVSPYARVPAISSVCRRADIVASASKDVAQLSTVSCGCRLCQSRCAHVHEQMPSSCSRVDASTQTDDAHTHWPLTELKRLTLADEQLMNAFACKAPSLLAMIVARY